jgi:nucleoid-associated protein EbfC
MKDMFGMLKKAQEMQAKMQAVQAELAVLTVDGSAAQGAVKVTMSGTHEVKSVSVSADVMDDKETLEDLLAVAFNDALNQANKTAETKMKAVTGGMNLPF